MSVDLTVGATYSITVTPFNSCGDGTTVTNTAALHQKPSGGSINSAITVCPADNTAKSFTVTGVNSVITPINYAWNVTQGSIETGQGSDAITARFGGLTANVLVTVTPSNICGDGAELSQTVTRDVPQEVTAGLTSDAINNVVYCQDETGDVVFTATSANAGPSPQYAYSVNGIEVRPLNTEPTHRIAKAGIVDRDIIRVNVTGAPGVCYLTSTSSAELTMDGYKTPVVSISASESAICEEDENGARNSINITAKVTELTSKGLQVISIFQDGSLSDNTQAGLGQALTTNQFTTAIDRPFESGTYSATAANAVCPEGATTADVDVVIYQEPNIMGLISKDNGDTIYSIEEPVIQRPIARGEVKELELEVLATPVINYSYDWRIEQDKSLLLNTIDSLATLSFVKETIDKISVTVTNVLCEESSTYELMYFLPLNIPNAFSPNGDGENDSWIIYGLREFPNAEVSIFNRWGNQVYKEIYTEAKAWKGEGFPVGTYYYIVKLNAPGRDDIFTGALTLVR